MTPKEELRQIRSLEEEILELRESLEEKETSATRITPSYSEGGGCSGVSDKVGDGAIAMAILEQQIKNSIDKVCLLKAEIMQKIDQVPNSTHRRILRLKYIDHKDWNQIAILIGYSLDWTYTLHGKALQEYGKVKEKI